MSSPRKTKIMKTKVATKPKRRVVEEEDDEVVNLPVPATRRKISKLKTKGMRSILGDSAEDIQQLLEVGEQDGATTLLYKRMLQSLVDLVPYAEHNVRKSKGARGVYQINSLMSSIRELLIDVQSNQDRGALGDSLVERVIRPVFLDIGMQIVQEYATVLGEAKDRMSPEDYKAFRTSQSESRGRIAAFIQGQYSKVKDESIAFLQR